MNEKKDEFKEWVVSTFDKEAEQELRRLQEKEEKFEVPEGVKEAVFERLQEQLRERNERNASRQEVEEGGNIVSRQHTEENDDNVDCRSVEEADDIINKLSPEDREALELGRKMMKAEIGATANDRKKSRGRKRPLKIYMALAAVIICVLAMGITSIGGPERVVRMVRQAVGDREVEKSSVAKSIKTVENEDEEEAYEKINSMYNTEVVQVSLCLKGMDFDTLKIDEQNQVAEMYYKYKNEKVAYFINLPYSDSSWGIDTEDIIEEKYEKCVKDCNVEIITYKIKSNNNTRCVAKFNYNQKEYFLTGTMERKDFEKILENLFFPK